MSDDDRKRELGERIRRRRERLGLTIDEAAKAGPVSPVTWVRLERGDNVRRLSYGAVDRALDWPEGACVDYLASGKEPPSHGEPTPDEDIAAMKAALADIKSRMDKRFGERRQRQREAAIEIIKAEIEESTTPAPDS